MRPYALIVLPVLSGVWLAGGVTLIGALTANYSHVSQFMSALGAEDAPYKDWTNYGVFIPTELLLLAFIAELKGYLSAPRRALMSLLLLSSYAILLLAAAFLPCDAGCRWDGANSAPSLSHVAHMTIATIAYPIAILGVLLLSFAVWQSRTLRSISLATALVGACFYAAIALWPDAQGLFQRALEAWIYAQMILIGRYVFAKPDAPNAG
ncbi:Protein of unknown function [Poseidonocella pacifica]|uniref:DUF998 domain-containing protein n=2 Tax=Poseidonocella pacifica TaxID=871651 RepID=A0A1I0Y2H2_9RHOB|nr:Protein of unknown function [Poseidonocella pacifica]